MVATKFQVIISLRLKDLYANCKTSLHYTHALFVSIHNTILCLNDYVIVIVDHQLDIPPCLLTDHNKMCRRGPSIDVCYQVSGHLAEGFQRRRLKCEKLTDDR
jgi:hypothetical protein